MLNVTTHYRRLLDEGLVMRAVESMDDVERLAAFNGEIHGPGIADMTRALIVDHPHTRPEHWLFIEDPATHAILSTLCLLPMTLRYADVSVRACEMGIVGTAEAYRRRGLIRVLNTRFSELVEEGGYNLCLIEGIAYFYRQFGYDYALPLEVELNVALENIPDATATELPTLRPATEADVPLLARLYDEHAPTLDIWSERDADMWRYLLGPSTKTHMVADTLLLLGTDGAPLGYIRIAHHGFSNGLIVSETSRLTPDLATALLRLLKRIAVERQKPDIRLNLPSSSTLVEVARWHKAVDDGAYAWQVLVPDAVRLLRTLTPVLEQRLAASPLAGLTTTLRLSLYRSLVELHFEDGRLTTIERGEAEGESNVRLHPALLGPLALGYRSFDELDRFYQDVSGDGLGRSLLSILFPPMSGFLYAIF